MRNSNTSNKKIKMITIAGAVAIFAIGTAFAAKVAGTVNSSNSATVSVVAAGNEATNIYETATTEAATQTVKSENIVETTAEIQTEEAVQTTEETTTETQTTAAAITKAAEPVTEAKVTEIATEVVTEAVTQAQVATATDSRVNEVINLINNERAAAGLSPVTYNATLTSMAQTRASENADNNFFVVQNGKHMRPDGRTASSICSDFGYYGVSGNGHFGEVMGRGQTSPAEIVTGWHNSATHYACMTNGVYTQVGVGVAAASDGTLYWVAIFMD